jgi:hypothetical protein
MCLGVSMVIMIVMMVFYSMCGWHSPIPIVCFIGVFVLCFLMLVIEAGIDIILIQHAAGTAC